MTYIVLVLVIYHANRQIFFLSNWKGVIILFHTRTVKYVYNGTETVSFTAQKTWDMVHDDIKNVTSLNEFKTKIKQWQHKNCT